MVWHFIENGQQAGPVDQATFDSMISAGRIKPDTQVWRDGMPNWAPYGSVASLGAVVGTGAQCAECGNLFPAEDLVQIGDRAVCAACKPVAVQKLKEGVVDKVHFRYAGFWIRVAARLVDGLIIIAFGFLVGFVIGLVFAIGGRKVSDATLDIMVGFYYILVFIYLIFFVGKYGATLGKMACGIRIVRSDGGRVGYGLAVGRMFSEILSAMTIYIGYIMAAFDDEKRALHDRICDTRVVYKR